MTPFVLFLMLVGVALNTSGDDMSDQDTTTEDDDVLGDDGTGDTMPLPGVDDDEDDDSIGDDGDDTLDLDGEADDDSVTGDDTADDTVADDTVADDTVADDTVADDTVADDTVADDTVADDTVADDTVADDTVSDDTVADDTVADDTIDDDTFLSDLIVTSNELDDTVNLADDWDSPVSLGQFEDGLDVGSGDDLIDLQDDDLLLDGLTITAGDGDDTVDVDELVAGTVLGGAGDDVLTATQTSGDQTNLFGGDGDDTIDASDLVNTGSEGGAGNDVMIMDDDVTAAAGTGYTQSIDGGSGEDTLTFTGGGQLLDIEALPKLSGGEGADVFDLTIDEGGVFDADSSAVQPDADGVLRLDAVEITDFETGVDQLIVSTQSDDPSYTFDRAQIMGANEDGTRTQLVLTFQSETGPDREVTINVGGTGFVISDLVLQ